MGKIVAAMATNTDRPALDADPLVALGAHPVGALMAVHVLQAEQRRLQKASR
jgi:hypothetical protein